MNDITYIYKYYNILYIYIAYTNLTDVVLSFSLHIDDTSVVLIVVTNMSLLFIADATIFFINSICMPIKRRRHRKSISYYKNYAYF